jgi:hypothetical protein
MMHDHDPGKMAPTSHLSTTTGMTVKNLGGEGMMEE